VGKGRAAPVSRWMPSALSSVTAAAARSAQSVVVGGVSNITKHADVVGMKHRRPGMRTGDRDVAGVERIEAEPPAVRAGFQPDDDPRRQSATVPGRESGVMSLVWT
jgi:methyl coenzyme M reductase alpha subunit